MDVQDLQKDLSVAKANENLFTWYNVSMMD